MTIDQRHELRQQWQQHLDAWQQSGKSQADYCREQGLVPHRFSYWKRRLHGASTRKLIPLATAAVSPVASNPAVTVTLPEGVRLEVPATQAVQLLPALLQALRAPR